VFANPASAYAIAFTPTVVTLRSARIVGDQIYIVLLIADGDGEEAMRRLSTDEADAASPQALRE